MYSVGVTTDCILTCGHHVAINLPVNLYVVRSCNWTMISNLALFMNKY